MTDKDLEGAVALVTGANGTVGMAICDVLRRKGVTVVATDIGSPSSDDGWCELDVTDEQSWQRRLEEINSRYQRLDILVNNAGVALMAKIESMPLEQWRLTQSVNVDGAFLGIKATTPLLRESGTRRHGGSAIINIASGAADRATAFSAAYCTSKAAVAMLTRATAVEFAALGYPIRVNSLHPGAVKSEMMDRILDRFSEITGRSVEEMNNAVLSGQPMGRYVEPEEVADVVAFLASSAARYVNGDAIHVDGGYAAA